jgi:uncharacterized repeat protein (TIGR01451 family)
VTPTVTITDSYGQSDSKAFQVDVADAPLTAAPTTLNATEGDSLTAIVASFADANPTTNIHDFTATIDWGDNTTSNGLIRLNGDGGFDVVGTHTYGDEGPQTIAVTIDDAGGQSITADSTANIADAPKPQTITFGPLPDQAYGVAPITLDATASSGLTVSYSVSGPVSLSGNVLTIAGAGQVTIVASQSGGDGYSAASDVTESFDVSPAPLTVTVDNQTMVYGSSLPALTGTLTGVVNGDNITASYSTTATAASHVVPTGYPITATLNDPDNRLGNYVVTDNPGILTITPAPLTITADDQTMFVGNLLPELTVTYNVFVNGDTEASLTTKPSASTTAVAGSPAGKYAITVSGAVDPDYHFEYVAGTLTIENPADHFQISAPVRVTAGNSFTLTVSAVDQLDNVVTAYSGTVELLCTNIAEPALPIYYTYTPTIDHGTATFTLSLDTAGVPLLAAIDTADNLSGSINLIVDPAAATKFLVAGFPLATTAGQEQDFSVTALDAFGNTATGYTGSVQFSSTDGQAALPAESTLINGTGDFKATLKTAGTQSLTATDMADNSIAGTESDIVVSPDVVSQLIVTGFPTPITAGDSGDFSVTAADKYGNTNPTYDGTVIFTSPSDPDAHLPAQSALSNGTGTFKAAFEAAGLQSLTATDAKNNSITGMQDNIVVNPAVVHTLQLAAAPATVTAGNATTVTVTLLDVFGNLVTGYTGTVHLSSNDPQAVGLPLDYTFTAADGGMHPFSVTLKTATSPSFISTLTATDTAGNLMGDTTVTVNPGAAAHLQVIASPATVTAGNATTVTVALFDVFGNLATGYTGTVQLSSNDPEAAGLPLDYTFTAADRGTHPFSVTLKTATNLFGPNQFVSSLTVQDTTNNLLGSVSVTVNPAAAAHMPVYASPTTVNVGVPVDISIILIDKYGNSANGTVTFATNDPSAVLSVPSYTFGPVDQGQHTIRVIFNTPSSPTFSPTITVVDAGDGLTSSASVKVTGGYTPKQILHAYGFDKITFGNGAIKGDGSGQTIAIIRALDDPFIKDDLQTFAEAFGLPSVDGLNGHPSLTVVAQDGSNNLPPLGNADDQSETALDVEWAHAIAPQANILLVETNSNRFGDSRRAVNWIRTQTGVSVVSMSSGIDNELSAEVSGDQIFATPSGHQGGGITFVAASGDNAIPTYPAVSPNVLGVGGTKLPMDESGNPDQSQESGWTESGGGVSAYESSPPYQSRPQYRSIRRASPDVAYDADPSTGFATFDTGSGGWFIGGGTSAGAPQWAALVAIADQGRSLSGLGTLDGAKQLLPLLYALPKTDFHVMADDGYSDLVTGLGSPVADMLIADLVKPLDLMVSTSTTRVTAGTPFRVTVSVKDSYGTVVPGYFVRFNINDLQAELAGKLPPDGPFVPTYPPNDARVQTFDVTLLTAGVENVSISDIAGNFTTSVSVTVDPAAAAKLQVNADPRRMTAGTAGNVIVTLFDAFGNVATGYTGTVHLSCNDLQAVGLPLDYTFKASDQGRHTFTVTLKTSTTLGVFTPTIFAIDVANNFKDSTSITVDPAAPSRLLGGGTSRGTLTAGATTSITVTAEDAYGNTITSYTGTVYLSSSDTQAVGPPLDYTFTAADQGTHTFSATLKTAGTITVTATDTANALNDSISFTVNPAAAAALVVSASPTAMTVGAAVGVILTVEDAYGNVVPGYTGTIHVSTNDPRAVGLPLDHTFTAADNGQISFNVTVGTASTTNFSPTISVTDAANGLNGSTSVTVAQATPAVSVTDTGGAYNGSPFPATATVAGVVAGVDASPGASLEGVPLTLAYYAGSSASGPALAGAPATAGTYTVVASFPGSADYTCASASTTFTIDAPLTATGTTILPTRGVTFTGVLALFTDADPSGTASDYTAAIAWGDGTPAAGTVGTIGAGSNGRFAVFGSHLYTQGGIFTVTVTISDAGGSQVTVTSTAKVGFAVTTTADSGPGSLRQAILNATATSDLNVIAFNIPGTGVQTIQPLTALPSISVPVILDGTTQSGFAGTPIIELDGSQQTGNVPFGLVLLGGNSTVQGLVINRFPGYGIVVEQNGKDVIQGNYIGTDTTGRVALGNHDGILLAADGNRVGTNADGVNDAAERNLIAGNKFDGIDLGGFSQNQVGGNNNVVAGNYIGTDVTGSAALGNAIYGIYLEPSTSGNTIGGTAAGAGNLISANGSAAFPGYGIYISSSNSNLVEGNLIGTDVTGEAKLGNAGPGVVVVNSATNSIGGTTALARNVISGNGGPGVSVENFSSGNLVQGNYIGTDAKGTAALGNASGGLQIGINAVNNVIGGTAAGAGNLISGNGSPAYFAVGITLFGTGTTGNLVQGNLIGTDVTGTQPLGNLFQGVSLQANASQNTIGGADAGAANVIAFNLGDGVLVFQDGTGNWISRNSIHNNGGLGINLEPVGEPFHTVTLNHQGGNLGGPNNLLNFPVLTGVINSRSTTTISGTYNGAPNTPFTLEFFSESALNPSGYGEGQTYLGSTSVTTDGTGNVSFQAVFPGVVPGDYFVTATATDPGNDTSEFSQGQVVQVGSADLALGLSVDNGLPFEGGTVTYTVTVDNKAGPKDATGVQVTDLLPAGLSFAGATPSQGAYNSSTGVWSVGNLTKGSSATLVLTATVNSGTAGTNLVDAASITALDQIDPNLANNSASATVHVPVQLFKMVYGSGPAIPEFTSVLPAGLYSPARGYGWIVPNGGQAPSGFDNRDSSGNPIPNNPLLEDGHTGADDIFADDLPAGNYLVTLTFGDAATSHDQIFAKIAGTTVVSNLTTGRGQFVSQMFPVTLAAGQQLQVEVSSTDSRSSFALNALTARPALVAAISWSGPTTLVADGSSTATFTGSVNLPDGSFITVATTLGTITAVSAADGSLTTADANPNYAGIQAVVKGGLFKVVLQSGTGAGTATLSGQEVTGAAAGATNVTLTAAAARKFQFVASLADGVSGEIGVLAGNLYSASRGYGWTRWGSAVHRTDGTDKFKSDGEIGTTAIADNTFRVQIDPKQPSYTVTVHFGDYDAAHTNVAVYVNDATTPTDTVSTAAGQFVVKSYTVAQANYPANGILDIRFIGTPANGFFFINGVDIATPLQASSLADIEGRRVAPLTPDELAPVLAEAEQLWLTNGLTPAQADHLRAAQFQIGRLGGPGYLGVTAGEQVTLDAIAAGYGWFLDATRWDSTAFSQRVTSTEVQAAPTSPAYGRMDLLTVVLHELGHVIGLPDLDPRTDPHGLMSETLDPGTRRLPAGALRLPASLQTASVLPRYAGPVPVPATVPALPVAAGGSSSAPRGQAAVKPLGAWLASLASLATGRPALVAGVTKAAHPPVTLAADAAAVPGAAGPVNGPAPTETALAQRKAAKRPDSWQTWVEATDLFFRW